MALAALAGFLLSDPARESVAAGGAAGVAGGLADGGGVSLDRHPDRRYGLLSLTAAAGRCWGWCC